MTAPLSRARHTRQNLLTVSLPSVQRCPPVRVFCFVLNRLVRCFILVMFQQSAVSNDERLCLILWPLQTLNAALRCDALRCGGMHIPVFWKPLLIKTCSGLQFDSMQTNINNNCCQISLTLFLIMRSPCKNKQ